MHQCLDAAGIVPDGIVFRALENPPPRLLGDAAVEGLG